jgi:peptidoglycan/xylan/chitin deacetylase (PgdA/CDA1 family)
VVYYHAIVDGQRQRFAKQMDLLVRYSHPIPAGHQKALQMGRRYAVVTFDDGFISVVQNAVPELQARRIPATIFVPTGSLGRNPTWVRDERSAAKKEIVLSSEQLKNLGSTELLTIGSHSVNHPNLVKLGPEQARAELIDSKSTLEGIVGSEVSLFSFPHGAHNDHLIRQAREAGYTRVFTISPRPALKTSEEFVTGRTLVDPSDWRLEFILKLQGAYRWLPMVSLLKARLLPRLLGNGRAGD